MINCLGCKRSLPLNRFDPDLLKLWKKNKDMTKKARCRTCHAKLPANVKKANKRKWQRDVYECCVCKQSLPPHKFNTAELSKLEEKDTLYLATCGSCKATFEEPAPGKLVQCNDCGEKKPVDAFSPARQRLVRDYKRWRCIICDFPPCEKCGSVPKDPKKKPYTCNSCNYPPCRCGAPRPQAGKYHVKVMKEEWKCHLCKHGPMESMDKRKA